MGGGGALGPPHPELARRPPVGKKGAEPPRAECPCLGRVTGQIPGSPWPVLLWSPAKLGSRCLLALETGSFHLLPWSLSSEAILDVLHEKAAAPTFPGEALRGRGRELRKTSINSGRTNSSESLSLAVRWGLHCMPWLATIPPHPLRLPLTCQTSCSNLQSKPTMAGNWLAMVASPLAFFLSLLPAAHHFCHSSG